MMRTSGIAGVTVVVLLGALLVTPPGHASGGPFGPFAPEEDYPPGITVKGGGLARVSEPQRLGNESIERAVEAARPSAIVRAVRDARRRAQAIGRRAGVGVGPVHSLELEQLFFERRRHCRAGRSGPVRCSIPRFTAAAVTVTFEIAGAAPGEEPRTLQAIGSDLALVAPADPGDEASIRRALVAARDSATPRAAARARGQIDAAAEAAGGSVGTIVSIVESAASAYYVDQSLGRYGPRRFCRMVRSRRFLGVDPVTGRPRIERGPARRRCSFPRRLSVSVETTYTLGPP